jgi:hypothetical protein
MGEEKHGEARLLLAGHALAGLLARGQLSEEEMASGLSVEDLAVLYADGLLKSLEKE